LGPYKDSKTLFGLALRGGVRVFVLDQLSIDPSVLIGYSFGSGTQKLEGGVTPVEFENSVSGIQFAISLGLSLWLK
jgi:hypothetical protein